MEASVSIPTTCICKTACVLHSLWAWHPPVGIWIGILGLLGVVVTLLRDPKEIGKGEKAVWIIILFALLFLEMKSVYQDRNEHDEAERQSRERSEQNFSEIANGIQGAVNGLNTTIAEGREHFDKTMVGLASAVNTQTGGESYASLLFVPQQGFMFFAHRGQFPLYEVTARITNLDDKNDLIGTTVSVGDMIKGHGNMVAVPANLAYLTDRINANIFFTARNGSWTELLRVRKLTNGSWCRAIRIEGLFTSIKRGKLMCETIDPQFPRAELDKEFAPYRGPKLPSCQ
jgi:hypothetical protein